MPASESQAPEPPPPPVPPLAHRAESEPTAASGSDATDRRSAGRGRRIVLIVVLLSVLLPFAACGFTLLACAVASGGFKL